MKFFEWNIDKDEWLRATRGVGFEEILYHITHDGLLDTIEHPNSKKYPGQRVFVVAVEGYACLVPFVEDDAKIFLKTIIPSRKMTKLYLGGKKPCN